LKAIDLSLVGGLNYNGIETLQTVEIWPNIKGNLTRLIINTKGFLILPD